MTEQLLEESAGSTSTSTDFMELAEPFRRELLAHCYRMSGSLHDAEDLVQETYLRAWRGYENFGGRSSLRTWLHRIATNVCLTALEGRSRRPLPTGLGAPSSDPTDDLVTRPEVPWLEPFPVGYATDDPSDPATIAASRDSVRLAFVAALQHLSARQRAVLLLREVLQWRATEVAAALDTSTAAVNSLLQRARAQLKDAQVRDDDLAEPDSAETKALLQRWVDGFEKYDIDSLVEMLTQDAVWEMPPFEGWYQGPDAIVSLIKHKCPAKGPGDQVLLPTVANGQPAFGLYMRGEDGRHHPFQLQVLDIVDGRVTHATVFFSDDTTALFARFGLPEDPAAR
ncbi:RNA polymerase, sigma subunit, ECF family [Rhodococcus rhodochrous J3]|uniref:RNA polymerase sigma factor n=2 Tax=Rhodococcus rhodochrous TaxID=1829 RepID=A0A562EQG7_RHORH|nr:MULTISPECIES: sigma-70 family RNA polymerase sigma factor [Rhodococcus]MDO1486209.1 sigma-70 family RNA polymerase sigma factor [Rhodococcus rhodochrous]MXQ78538.1 sigma-70 family RNA polymerase sigma factor [Rhodococcus rhodochrous]OWY81109.1 RNA polymerase subunit sigma-70 [Rhodococcus sp. BUPNP1]TWH24125.1 RNA polymerase sigma-70 factor (ECF subfamily) [Rhodococcus rhodochrous J45]SMG54615.1 RNA polymerase, sigma subunit, ECF family [Rhodococcus rhodochrous J3]